MFLVNFILAVTGGVLVGVPSLPEAALPFFMILLTFLVGSFLNDVIVRGYVFGHLKGKLPMRWVFLLSLAIYMLDDVWNEGLQLGNMFFSLLLGLSLTYMIYRTGSLWATTGIHWGLYVCYGIFNGTVGSSGGGIVRIEWQPATILTESISYLVLLAMFLVLFLMRSRFAFRDTRVESWSKRQT